MKWITSISPLIKEVEMRNNPVIVRVNKFDEEAAKKFDLDVARAHNSGQKVIPVVIDSCSLLELTVFSSIFILSITISIS